jgi:hypothetical protein
VVSFGDALYRAMDAVECLKAEGIDVGLINKVSNPCSSLLKQPLRGMFVTNQALSTR